jgi:hypothetical protein
MDKMDNQAELRLKVLELAREMLHNSYVETKARIHNEWALKSDLLWKTSQRTLPYPQLPSYFTETDVLHKVVPLWRFVRDGELVAHPAPPVQETLPEPPPCEPPEQEPEPEPEPVPVNNPPYMEMPQPVMFPSQVPPVTPHVDVPGSSMQTDTDVAPQNRGLKVLPAWMTKRS